MSSCAKCIFKPFCHSAGYVCSSFKDKDRFADRNEVIREFADKLKAILNPFVSYDESAGFILLRMKISTTL